MTPRERAEAEALISWWRSGWRWTTSSMVAIGYLVAKLEGRDVSAKLAALCERELVALRAQWQHEIALAATTEAA